MQAQLVDISSLFRFVLSPPSLTRGLTLRRVLFLSLHSVPTDPELCRCWSATRSVLPNCSVTSSRSTPARTPVRPPLTAQEKEGNVRTPFKSLGSPCPTLTRPGGGVANGSASKRGRSPSLDLPPPTVPRLDALPIKSTTVGVGGQRRRSRNRGQEGESFIDDEVGQQQSGSESDKGLGSSSNDHDRSSGDERITSRFTVQETSLWR